MTPIDELKEARKNALEQYTPLTSEIRKVEVAYMSGRPSIKLEYETPNERQNAFNWWINTSQLKDDISIGPTMSNTELLMFFLDS